MCFPVSFAKLLRILFFMEHLRLMFLSNATNRNPDKAGLFEGSFLLVGAVRGGGQFEELNFSSRRTKRFKSRLKLKKC